MAHTHTHNQCRQTFGQTSTQLDRFRPMLAQSLAHIGQTWPNGAPNQAQIHQLWSMLVQIESKLGTDRPVWAAILDFGAIVGNSCP